MSNAQAPEPELAARRRTADRIFNAALDLQGEARAALIERECADDTELRALVLGLLEAYEEDDEPFDETADLLEAVRRELATQALASDQVGPYRLVREIGAGGMGVVYLGERIDGLLEQQVAIKILPAPRIRSLGERFSQERQILADLDHPGIARLLDAGTTARGLPYLVMELVDGQPIDAYCDEKRLGLEARLRLFCEVCEAVEAAHRSLVVHRDIKPSNIMVTVDGQAKLLDFGIAKLVVEDPRAPHTTARMLTLEWASPEQILGAPTTVQSDVYQLGLLLYVLLTGRLPYNLEGLTPVMQTRVICEQEVMAPSVMLRSLSEEERDEQRRHVGESGRPGAAVKGDLDAITLEALRKEPRRRYDSVAELRRDVERHLAREPITARLPTVRYRALRFAQRHRWAVLATSLAALLFLTLAFWSIRRITAERNLARQEAERAEQRAQESRAVTDFLAGLLRRASPYRNRDPEQGELTVRQALDLGVDQLRTELQDTPLVRARILNELAQVFEDLDDGDRVVELAGQAAALYAEAGDAYRKEHGFALLRIGIGNQELAEHGEARRHLEAGLAIVRQLDEPALTSTFLMNLAINADTTGDSEAAGRYFDEALEALEGRDEPDIRRQRALLLGNIGIFNKNLGVERRDLGPLLKSEASLLRSLEEIGELPELAPRRPMTLVNLGNVYYEMERFEEAEKTLREGLEGITELFGADSTQAAIALSNLGKTLATVGRFEEGEAALQQSLAIRRKALGEDHPRVAVVLERLGDVKIRQDQHAEAIPYLERCLAIRRARFGDRHPEVGMALRDLGRCHVATGREDLARPAYTEALALFQAAGLEKRADEIRKRLDRLGPPAR